MHIMRYADALLMYAEALNEVGNTAESITVLNRVRGRAFGNKDHNVAGLSKDALREKSTLSAASSFPTKASGGSTWYGQTVL